VALDKKIVAFVGGVGGAKLALGLTRLVPPECLTIIVNTGDDLWYYGLRVCPDVDTVLYTLSGRVNAVNGWGVAGDTQTTLETLRGLGDKDIAVHMLRTHLLQQGNTLTQVISHLAQAMGIAPTILPMTDAPVATMVNTLEQGELEFQEYFVKHRWQPTVTALRFAGAEAATLSDEVRDALANADVILFAPSNPWLSIAPILAVPGMQAAIEGRNVPRVAITPIVAGNAIKGPAAKLMGEMGYEVSPAAVAHYYGNVINGFVYDIQDNEINLEGLHAVALDTIMKTDEDKIALARLVLGWIETWEAL
jgi:LPPG:FO 2-phospho-L-lactate transferase